MEIKHEENEEKVEEEKICLINIMEFCSFGSVSQQISKLIDRWKETRT